MTDYDAIVVGSGAGGLGAALRMSQQGVSVLLLEAAPSFGGYLNAFTRKGYSFDTGLHYLGELAPGGSFRMLLELLEIDKEVSFVELNPDGFDCFYFPDFELRLCKGKEQYQERLLELFPNESKPIKKFFHTIDQLMKAFSDRKGPPKNILDENGYMVSSSGPGEAFWVNLPKDDQRHHPQSPSPGSFVAPTAATAACRQAWLRPFCVSCC